MIYRSQNHLCDSDNRLFFVAALGSPLIFNAIAGRFRGFHGGVRDLN
jgi:hypothetical protein